MIFISTDILSPYKREIVSQDSYKTLIDFLKDKYPNGFKRPTDVSINGLEIAIDDYDTKLNEKDVVALLDRAALPVGLIGGWFITALANLAISVTLSYVANKLFAPDAPGEQASPSSVYALNNAQNIARFGSPIPIIYGKVRAYPSMIVQPYYKFEDDIEYLYHVLCVGQGTLATDEILIGEDSIDSTGDLEWKLLYSDSFYDIPQHAYGIHVTKTLTSPSTMELKIADGESEKYKINAEAEYLEFDYMYPNGIKRYEDDGETTSAQTSFDVKLYIACGTEYAEIHSESIYISASTIDPIQKTKRIDISSYTKDVYVSFTKTLGTVTSKNITNTFIKRVKEIHPNEDFTQLYGDITLLTTKIKATNAVSTAGQVKVNGYFERTDVGNTMSEVLTDLYTNTNYGGGLNSDDLSFPVTSETVDCAYDSNMTIFDAMRKPALAQGYSLYLAGMDVILKKDGANTITSGMYNEMNILRDSMKMQYIFKEEYPSYDGFECKYIDGNGWIPKSEKYPATSTRPQVVDLFGVVNWDSTYVYEGTHTFDICIVSDLEPSLNDILGSPETDITIEQIASNVWHAYSDLPITYARFGTNKTSVTHVTVANAEDLTSTYAMFQGMTSLTSIDLIGIDTSSVTDMDLMFSSCSSITDIDCSMFDTSLVLSMDSLFDSTNALKTVDIGNFDTSNVTSMRYMFNNSGVTAINFTSFTFGAVDMTRMFADAQQLTCISNINTLSATTTSLMFLRNYALVSPDATAQNEIMNLRSDWVGDISCGG